MFALPLLQNGEVPVVGTALLFYYQRPGGSHTNPDHSTYPLYLLGYLLSPNIMNNQSPAGFGPEHMVNLTPWNKINRGKRQKVHLHNGIHARE